MNTILLIALAVLANYRVAYLVSSEDGPADIFSRLQARASEIKNKDWQWVSRGLNCPLCVGFWTSLVFALILLPMLPVVGRRRFMLLLLWLGIAGGQTVIHKVVG